jgi:hypothetical protein
MSHCFWEPLGNPLWSMPHLNPLITPSAEKGHREPMTINVCASINYILISSAVWGEESEEEEESKEF